MLCYTQLQLGSTASLWPSEDDAWDTLSLHASEVEELVGLFDPDDICPDGPSISPLPTPFSTGLGGNTTQALNEAPAPSAPDGHQLGLTPSLASFAGSRQSVATGVAATEGNQHQKLCSNHGQALLIGRNCRQDSLASTTSTWIALPTALYPSAVCDAESLPSLMHDSPQSTTVAQQAPLWDSSAWTVGTTVVGTTAVGTTALEPPSQAALSSSSQDHEMLLSDSLCTSSTTACMPALALQAAWSADAWAAPAASPALPQQQPPQAAQLQQALEAVIALPLCASKPAGLPVVQHLCRALHADLSSNLHDSPWPELHRLCQLPLPEPAVQRQPDLTGASSCPAGAPAVVTPSISDANAKRKQVHESTCTSGADTPSTPTAARRSRARRCTQEPMTDAESQEEGEDYDEEEDEQEDPDDDDDEEPRRVVHRHRTPPRDRRGGRRGHKRLPNNPWIPSQTLALVDAVERCGCGRWAEIKRLRLPELALRSTVDLKDKWRNLQRTARLSPAAMRAKCAKKRETSLSLVLRVKRLCEAGQAADAAAGKAAPVVGKTDKEVLPRRSGLRVRA